MDLLWPIIALAVGFGAGWVLSGKRLTDEMARFEGRLEELQGKLVRAQRANEALLAEADASQDGPPRSTDDLADSADDEAEGALDDGFDGDGERDDLTRIRGIGAVLQDKLYDLGITSFQQVAALTPEETARLEEALSLRGRIERDDWVGQAKRLSAQ